MPPAVARTIASPRPKRHNQRDKRSVSLRIGIVTEYYYPLLGGISENVHHTATELVARGHDVTIITSAPAFNGSPLAHPNGIPVRRVGRSGRIYGNGAIAHFAVGGVGLWQDLKEVLRSEPFDILQLHSPLFFTLPPLAALLGRCARVGTFHSYFAPTLLPTLVYNSLKGILQKQFVDRLDGVTVVSPSVLQALSRYFEMDNARVIPNGVDTRMFTPNAPRLARFTDDKRTLLFLGRFDPRNGLPFMIRAFAEVRKRMRDVRLVIVGTGPLEPVYRNMVPEDLRDDVHFEGPALVNRPSYYTTADVFCSPISNASFGITLLESMACGTPIVATDNVGYRDLLDPAEGLLVPGNEGAFADAIIQVLTDDRLRQGMREAGLRKAERYSWPRVVGSLLDYFEEVVGHQ
jgi:phosphatidylinositol alpha-mannosyltransferase